MDEAEMILPLIHQAQGYDEYISSLALAYVAFFIRPASNLLATFAELLLAPLSVL